MTIGLLMYQSFGPLSATNAEVRLAHVVLAGCNQTLLRQCSLTVAHLCDPLPRKK